MNDARAVQSADADAGDSSMSRGSCDVVIIGAGPYGLAAAARLRELPGLEVRTIGDPMQFWRDMPKGMLLRSAWEACHIGYPSGALTLDRFQAASGSAFGKPVPREAFVDYGDWFQAQAVPGVEHGRVASVARSAGRFEVTLEDSATIEAERVVVAAGIGPFAWWPPEFSGLSSEFVSHSSEHTDLSRFAHQSVLVVGGGQSALESAALMHEANAQVEVVARAPRIVWLHGGVVQRKLGRAKPLMYAQTDVGPAGISRIVANPSLFRRLPRPVQERMAHRAIRPAGARWLVARLAGVPITTGRSVTRVARAGDMVEVFLDDGSTRRVDHVLLGTGYRVDVAKYDFLSEEILEGVQRVGGYPVVGPGFESSVAGLHFLGAPAAWSFGPIMRFVSGSWFAARELKKALANARMVRT
jgi:hypothetical protein